MMSSFSITIVLNQNQERDHELRVIDFVIFEKRSAWVENRYSAKPPAPRRKNCHVSLAVRRSGHKAKLL